MGTPTDAHALGVPEDGIASPPRTRRYGSLRFVSSPGAGAAGAVVPVPEPRHAPLTDVSGTAGAADALLPPAPLPPFLHGRRGSTGNADGAGFGDSDVASDAPVIDPACIGTALSSASNTAQLSAAPARAERSAVPPGARSAVPFYVELSSDSGQTESDDSDGAGSLRQSILAFNNTRAARMARQPPDDSNVGARRSPVGLSEAESGNGSLAHKPVHAGGLGAGDAAGSAASYRSPAANVTLAAGLREDTPPPPQGVSPGTPGTRREGSLPPPAGGKTAAAGPENGASAIVGAPRTPGRVKWVDLDGPVVLANLAAVGAASGDAEMGRPMVAAGEGSEAASIAGPGGRSANGVSFALRAGARGEDNGLDGGGTPSDKRPRRSESSSDVLRPLFITGPLYAPPSPRVRPVSFTVAELEFRRENRKPSGGDTPTGAGVATSHRPPAPSPTRGAVVARAAETALRNGSGRGSAIRLGAATGSPGSGPAGGGVHLSALRSASRTPDSIPEFAAPGFVGAAHGTPLPPRMRAVDLSYFWPELHAAGSLAPSVAGASVAGGGGGRRPLSTRLGVADGSSGGSLRGDSSLVRAPGTARGGKALLSGDSGRPEAGPGKPAARAVPAESLPLAPSLPRRTLTLPSRLLPDFLDAAAVNTNMPPRGIETSGVLCGHADPGGLVVTHVIVPEQIGAADTFEVTPAGETALHFTLAESGLIVLGWIHTHPSQSCFMSSIDLHTHLSYQLLVPEAVAVVAAPRAPEGPSFAVYRLTASSDAGRGGVIGGLELIQACNLRGFHAHDERTSLYEESGHVRWRLDAALVFIDLR
jgi:proteasome lid subunit RPN8/RPN11